MFQLQGVEEYNYLDLVVKTNTIFGEQIPIILPNSNTRNFSIILKRSVLGDGTLLEPNDDGAFQEITAPVEILTSDPIGEQYLRELRSISSVNHKYKFIDLEDYWICSCGSFNLSSSDTCFLCNVKKIELIRLSDPTYLKERLEEENVGESTLKKQRSKRTMIACSVSAFLIILGVMLYKYTSIPIPVLVSNNSTIQLSMSLIIGKNVDMKNSNGETGLHIAVQNNNLDMIEQLVQM